MHPRTGFDTVHKFDARARLVEMTDAQSTVTKLTWGDDNDKDRGCFPS